MVMYYISNKSHLDGLQLAKNRESITSMVRPQYQSIIDPSKKNTLYFFYCLVHHRQNFPQLEIFNELNCYLSIMCCSFHGNVTPDKKRLNQDRQSPTAILSFYPTARRLRGEALRPYGDFQVVEYTFYSITGYEE